MPGVIALRRTHAIQPDGEKEASMATQNCCPQCNTAFALAEKRVRHEGADYHEDCAKKRRIEQTRQLFITHAPEIGLRVEPRHSVTHRN